jgi:hypothetical protein
MPNYSPPPRGEGSIQNERTDWQRKDWLGSNSKNESQKFRRLTECKGAEEETREEEEASQSQSSNLCR